MRRWERARSGRGPVRADRRRARHWQVAAARGVPRAARRDLAHLGRMGVVAALAEHAAAPDRGMGPFAISAQTCRPTSASPISKTRLQLIGLDPAEYAPLVAPLVDIPLPTGRAATSAARRVAAPAACGARRLGSGRRPVAAGRARVRGPAVGRPDFARSDAGPRRARRAGADAHHRDGAAGVSPALGLALASQRDFARPARSRASAANGRRVRLAPGAVEGGGRGGERARGRRAAVCRGGDALALERGEAAACTPFRRLCSNPSPRGSTGLATRARSRRSARSWGASSPMRYCARCRRVDDRAPPVRARSARRRRPPLRRGRAARRRPIASSTR